MTECGGTVTLTHLTPSHRSTFPRPRSTSATTAHAAGAAVAERIEWVKGDLGTWTPPPGRYDLISCLYIHVAGSVVEMVRRLGTSVAPGGTLLLVEHRPADPATGAPTPAAGQVQISVDEAVEALDLHEWDIAIAEERPRAAVGTGLVMPKSAHSITRSRERGRIDEDARHFAQKGRVSTVVHSAHLGRPSWTVPTSGSAKDRAWRSTDDGCRVTSGRIAEPERDR